MDQSGQNFDSYWAAETDTIALISYLSQNISDFDRYIDMSGRWLTVDPICASSCCFL